MPKSFLCGGCEKYDIADRDYQEYVFEPRWWPTTPSMLDQDHENKSDIIQYLIENQHNGNG